MNGEYHDVNIRDVNIVAFWLKNKYFDEEKKKAEDLNDKKCAWLSVALDKGIRNLNSRDKAFAEQYLRENIHYSMHFMFKDWLPKFIEQQRVRYGLK